jgi:hypothetical protein
MRFYSTGSGSKSLCPLLNSNSGPGPALLPQVALWPSIGSLRRRFLVCNKGGRRPRVSVPAFRVRPAPASRLEVHFQGLCRIFVKEIIIASRTRAGGALSFSPLGLPTECTGVGFLLCHFLKNYKI